MTSFSRELEVMVAAARLAGASLRRDFARLEALEVREKAASDFVSDADLDAQEIVRVELVKAFPDASLELEEGASVSGAKGGMRFFVDPLDGTTNFLHGIPHFAVSIGLEVDGELAAGVVYDPAKEELFSATRGGGATLNDRPMKVSKEPELVRSVIGTGIPHHARGDHPPYLEALAVIMRDFAGVRRMGAAALDLAYVAAGRYEAFFEIGLAPWDVAAGTLLVREAGGIVTRTGGGASSVRDGDILASATRELHAAMIPRLAPLRRR